MSAGNENNIKVSINEEYDRVLSNPEGLIMSDGLAERLEGEWDLAGALKNLESATATEHDEDSVADTPSVEYAATASSDKNSVRVFSEKNANVGLAYCEVQTFTSMDGEYSLGILVRGDQKKFMSTLMALQHSPAEEESGFGLDVTGRNGFIALGVKVSSWSFAKVNSYDTTITINFGSQHVEF